jgi:hypothetical protein
MRFRKASEGDPVVRDVLRRMEVKSKLQAGAGAGGAGGGVVDKDRDRDDDDDDRSICHINLGG